MQRDKGETFVIYCCKQHRCLQSHWLCEDSIGYKRKIKDTQEKNGEITAFLLWFGRSRLQLQSKFLGSKCRQHIYRSRQTQTGTVNHQIPQFQIINRIASIFLIIGCPCLVHGFNQRLIFCCRDIQGSNAVCNSVFIWSVYIAAKYPLLISQNVVSTSADNDAVFFCSMFQQDFWLCLKHSILF